MRGTPLRVALLSYRSLPTCGGQGVYVRHLSRELVALGHQVSVFSGQPYPVLDAGVELVRLPSLDLYREPDPFRWPGLREFRGVADITEFAMMRTGQFAEPLGFSIRAHRALRPTAAGPPPFDIIHDNQGLGYGLAALRRQLRPHHIPLVATVHHPITVDRRLHLAATTGLRARFGVRRWYSFLPMQARVARNLDGVLVPSESSRRGIVTDMKLDFEAMHTVPLGVESDVFRPDPAVPKVPGRVVVVTSADVPLKGLLVMLEALAKVRVERDAHLVCVGKARVGGSAERQVAELGLSDAVTFRSDLPEPELVGLLQSAEVAVVPSLYEGFSLPAVEEMAVGLPLVATTAGALPEVAGPQGEAALLVPPGDPGALADAVGRLLDDAPLRARMGAAGRSRVEARFSWTVATTATADWYAERIEALRSGPARAPRARAPMPGSPGGQGGSRSEAVRPAVSTTWSATEPMGATGSTAAHPAVSARRGRAGAAAVAGTETAGPGATSGGTC